MGDSLSEKQMEMIKQNPRFKQVKMPQPAQLTALDVRLKKIGDPLVIDLIMKCLTIDPDEWLDCGTLLEHEYFEDMKGFEDDIQFMINWDDNEFHMDSTIRDGDTFLSPWPGSGSPSPPPVREKKEKMVWMKNDEGGSTPGFR